MSSYPWIKDSQYVNPLVTGYLAITSPNGLYAANNLNLTANTNDTITMGSGVGITTNNRINLLSTSDSIYIDTPNGSVVINGVVVPQTTIGTATNANNVAISEDATSNATFYPTFVNGNSGYRDVRVDSTTSPLSYNPFTSTLTATNFAGTATRATNIAGGLGGQIPYQSAVNTTALLANGTSGQYLKSNGTTLAPSWVNQNTAATPSGLPTTISSVSANQTLTVNFNSSFSSVTNYTVNFTGSATTTQTITAYTLSGGVTGGQYSVVIQLFCSGGGATTWTFNGTGLASTQKTNFVTISTTAMATGNTRYVVLTFAYDGTNYYLSGSNFT